MRGKYVYFKVSLEFELSRSKSNSIEVLPVFFKGSLVQSLQQVFGEIGGLSVPVDILRLDEEGVPITAILRVPATDYFKLRTALSLIGQFQGHPARFNVLCVSPVLLSLVRADF